MRKAEKQSVFPSGMFSQTLMAAECNSQMFEFMGAFVYSSLYKMMREDDIPKMEKLMDVCHAAPDVPIESDIHMVGTDGYDTYVMNLCYRSESNKYHIELKNLAYSEKVLEKTELEKEFLKDFLTISGCICFAYNVENEKFSLFWLDYEQKIMLYEMPLTDWEEEMLERKLIEPRDEEVFRAFCDSVRRAVGQQSYVFHGSIFTEGKNAEAYRVKYEARDHGTGVIVEGVWLNINEQTGDVLDDYVTGNQLDSLTKLLNKKAIEQYAEKEVSGGANIAIVMIDVDNFKSVNDNYGHPFGDKLIAGVADVIKHAIGAHGVAGRVGGDEFMIVLENKGDELALRNYLRSIRTNVRALYQAELGDKKISCSMGISRSRIDANNFSELYRIADRALYIAKQKGKNRYIIYKPELHGRFNTSSDDMDMKEIKGAFYSEKEVEAFYRKQEEFVQYGSSRLQELIAQMAKTAMVDRIVVFWGEERKAIAVYPLGSHLPEKNQRLLFESEKYQELFSGDLLEMSNVNELEYLLPGEFAIFKETDTKSFLQYYLRDKDGNVAGLISMEQCSIMKRFPQLAVQLFCGMSVVINAVLLREESLDK